MNEKLYAPQIDNFIDWLGDINRGRFNDNCTFTEMSYKLIDKFFDLLKRISPVSENGCRELWFCVERGTIEDFGDYEDLYKTGEIESYEGFEQLWKDFYPKEKKWYYVEAVHDEEIDYKAVMLNHKLVIVVDPRAEKGFEYNIDIFANWLYEETEKCIKQMNNGTYMNFIRANLPFEHRTGTITQKNLWNIYPDSKKEFFEGLSDKDIDDFIAAVTKQEEKPEKITGRLHSITANDFYGYCSIGYSAMGYDIGSMTPKEQYFRFADGRDGGLSEINENSSEEFVKWLNGSEWHGSHPWEVCRGGNSTHISLMRCSDLCDKLSDFKMKRKYHDYRDDEYNCDELKFIWGVKSWDDISSDEANLYTMNDLDIVFDRKRKEYILGIETIYSFAEGNKGEVVYLENLLDKFTEFAKENNCLPKDGELCLCSVESAQPWRAATISELYIRFKVFVNGYKSVVAHRNN